MKKVNEFEYGIERDSLTDGNIVSTILNDDEANVHYRYSADDNLADDTDAIKDMIEHHLEHQVPRLRILNDYYLGKNSYIYGVQRRIDKEKSDHRISNNFARYISQFIQGYLVGNPIKVGHKDEKIAEQIQEINAMNDADSINEDLVLDVSKYGRAYELVIRNNEDEDRFYLSDVMETFIIYSDTIDMKPVGAIRYVRKRHKDGEYRIKPTLYTERNVVEFAESKMDEITIRRDGEPKEHGFDGVPVIEYQNNRFRQGDYENVISLIDAYDSAQSDTANYMTDLNDALLVIIGNVKAPENMGTNLREANAVHLEPSTDINGKESPVSVGYEYKKYDVAGTEAYKRRIAEDIHKFSNTPNMNDENFASNTSGVAMRYKLFGLEQARANKETLFEKGLRQRYKLIASLKTAINELSGDANMADLSITFTPNFPEAEEEELKAFIDAGGQLSLETLLKTLSFVDDVDAEMERIAEEQNNGIEFTDEQKADYDRMRESLFGGIDEERQQAHDAGELTQSDIR